MVEEKKISLKSNERQFKRLRRLKKKKKPHDHIKIVTEELLRAGLDFTVF